MNLKVVFNSMGETLKIWKIQLKSQNMDVVISIFLYEFYFFKFLYARNIITQIWYIINNNNTWVQCIYFIRYPIIYDCFKLLNTFDKNNVFRVIFASCKSVENQMEWHLRIPTFSYLRIKERFHLPKTDVTPLVVKNMLYVA